MGMKRHCNYAERSFQRLTKLVVALLIPVMAGLFLPGTQALAGKPPKLVLQITVDALRGDLPTRFFGVLGEDGFRYLMEKGVYYANAHYQHAETIVGHTSLATGTVPAAHGMVANVWFDREQGRLAYNIEDPRYHLLTAGADVDRKTEIDPTQRKARSDGRSPENILTSTFSDELAVHNTPPADPSTAASANPLHRSQYP